MSDVAVGRVRGVLHGAPEREGAHAVLVLEERVLAEQIGIEPDHVHRPVERLLRRPRSPPRRRSTPPAWACRPGRCRSRRRSRSRWRRCSPGRWSGVCELRHLYWRRFPMLDGIEERAVSGGDPLPANGVPLLHQRLVVGTVLARPPRPGAVGLGQAPRSSDPGLNPEYLFQPNAPSPAVCGLPA